MAKKTENVSPERPIDELNRRRSEEFRQRARSALKKISRDLDKYRKKPTTKDLATLAKCSSRGLEKAAARDAQERGLVKRDRKGDPLLDEAGNPILDPVGWPLEELRTLQFSWKERQRKDLQGNPCRQSRATEPNQDPETLRILLSRYQRQVKHMFARLEKQRLELADVRKAIKTYIDQNSRLEDTAAKLRAENVQLKKAQMTVHQGGKKS